MKKIKLFILLTTMITGFFSCQKSGSTTTPTHPMVDTAYLRKTAIFYGYDASGNKTSDSTVWRWGYDDQRRQTLFVSRPASGDNVDSSITSYSANQAVTDYWIISEGVLYVKGHEVSFYNTKGYLDSVQETIMNISPNNGSPDTTHANTVTVYYNDANGHDTTAILYDLSTGGRVRGNTTFSVYVNNSLTRVMSYTRDGVKTNSQSWTDGNIVADTTWNFNDGSLLFTHSYSFSSVLSGGFYGYVGTKNLLLQGTQANSPFGSSNYTYTNTYTFDTANRVSTQKEVLSNQPGYHLDVYTYY